MAKKKEPVPAEDEHEEIEPLDAEDEEILDEIWDRIAKREARLASKESEGE